MPRGMSVPDFERIFAGAGRNLRAAVAGVNHAAFPGCIRRLRRRAQFRRTAAKAQRDGGICRVARPLRKGVHSAPFLDQARGINIAAQQATGKRSAFRQNHAVFRKQVMPGKHHVRGRLPESGVGVDVTANAACRNAGNQLPPVSSLADDFVAGRQIGNKKRACEHVGQGRAVRHPKIFADFHRKRNSRIFFILKQDVRPERDAFLAENSCRQDFRLCRTRLEMAHFIEFPVIRNMRFGNNPGNFSAGDDGGAIIPCVLVSKRKADHGNHRKIPGLFGNVAHCRQRNFF